jgi:hypothetical protein
MLFRCLNPGCNALFRYLYDGRIFTVERFVTSPDGCNGERIIEHYWLCGPCSMAMKVVVEDGVATAVPINPESLEGSTAKATRQLPVG